MHNLKEIDFAKMSDSIRKARTHLTNCLPVETKANMDDVLKVHISNLKEIEHELLLIHTEKNTIAKN
jgi:hypothetical protein